MELDAFQKGFMFWETPRPKPGPPEDDTERQEWLVGFQQASADYPDTLVRR
jgi:hypothetical protein